MSQVNLDRLSRRGCRAQKRMAGKEAKRQDKVVEEKDPQGRALAGFMEPTIHKFQQNALPLLAFLAAIFVFYFPALSGEFIWDDVILSEEEAIHNWSGLWSIWFAPSEIVREKHYWPMTYTTFWLEHKLFGLSPIGYHIVNCILYFTNVVLIWRLLLRLEVPGAWAISMLFTVHPLHVESVAWVIEQKSLLSALFYLGSVHVWLRFRESPNSKTYALALGLYVLGLLSKSIVVTLPATLLVLLWWKQERVTAQDVMRVLPFFIVGFVVTLGDYLFYVSLRESELAYSFLERTLIAAQSVWFYVGKLLWPANLIVIYPHWNVSVGNLVAWLCVAATVGVLILLWSCRSRIGKGPLAGIVFFIITLSPILGFMDYGYMQHSFVADRYQYLAGLGLIAVLVGGAVHAMQSQITSFRPVFRGAFAVLVIGLGALTWRQAAIYQEGIVFFRHITTHNPVAYNAYYNLGSVLFEAGRYEESYEASLKATEFQPDKSLAHANVAGALIEMERYGEAEESIRRAVELDPQSDVAWQNYGSLHFRQQRYEEAVVAYQKAIDLGADSTSVYINIADSYYELGHHTQNMELIDRASTYLQRILKLAGDSPETLLIAADALREQKQYAKAIKIYKKILAIDFNFAKAYAGMGDALFRLERYEEAIESLKRSIELHSIPSSTIIPLILMGESSSKLGRSLDATQYYERAVELGSQNVNALGHLATVRFQEKRYEEALRLFRSARDSRPELAQTHANIGAILYHLGRFEEAARSYETALSLDPNMEHVRSSLKQLKRTLEGQE